MNNYKVGDRVWWKGLKMIVRDEITSGYWLFKKQHLELINNDSMTVVTTSLCLDLKPILKVKNGVVCE